MTDEQSIMSAQRVGVSMSMDERKKRIVYQTCQLLVGHFQNLLEHNGPGFNTRIFSHMLHPERAFIFAGQSAKVTSETPTHPEHVVPCATLINECNRLILANTLSNDQIATLLQKHWKLADITKEEQRVLDFELKLKSRMPDGWSFETGDTFERLNRAEITLLL